ncbi:tyrosine-type recombinase/integrase [Caulobacter vibrioides]|uniref:tyrosine-type recombinase/integrase n=1 Tax=Caulobacter vibrioides TaxID=155892 RepID=UPI000BB480C6|nr:tyrosine-type recombinase/integrase [Caulobacter vibrioides]ATC25180.1 integrase [Caulobacter vibrioides]PLR13951.1 integrase [Caulobacter vibrioides]
MPVVRLKGLNRVRKVLKDGSVRVHWYAWKGGPKLEGQPGSPEFIASYNRAVDQRRAPRNDTLAGLVTAYKAAPEFQKLATSTQAEWRRWLDRISADEATNDIGGLTLKLLDDRRTREDVLDWRDQYADRPRTADYGMQVLSRVLGWAVDRGRLAINIAAGVEQLYKSDRADQIWTAEEVAAYRAAAPSPEVGYIVALACVTGLRREDLAKLTWKHVGDLAIVVATGKSQGRRSVTIPLLPDAKILLSEIKAQQTARHAELVAVATKKKRPPPPVCLTVLSNTRGQPWSVSGLEHQVIDTKTKAGVGKHLHDARGTFATRLRKAGLTAPEIADILAWDEKRVERILAKYVDRDTIVRALAERIARNESGSAAPNSFPTLSDEGGE